jgi:hypothetical protein
MRLSELMKKQKLNEDSIKSYFEALGWEFSSINKKITDEECELILETHKQSKKSENISYNRIIQNPRKSKPIDLLPIEFRVKNRFETETINIVNGTVDFDNREKHIILNENLSVESFLTDFEAFSICNGLKDGYYKKLSQKFFSGVKDSETLFNGHQIAMQTIQKYGRELIFHLISLPPLPFKATNTHQIFSELDKKKSMTHDPVIRLLFENENEKIQFSFYKKPESNPGAYYSNVIVAKCKSKNEVLFLLSRDGRIVPQSKSRNVGPIINTFISYSKDLGRHILHYGLVTGECSICGRILSDPDSVRIGIGPVCRDGMRF